MRSAASTRYALAPPGDTEGASDMAFKPAYLLLVEIFFQGNDHLACEPICFPAIAEVILDAGRHVASQSDGRADVVDHEAPARSVAMPECVDPDTPADRRPGRLDSWIRMIEGVAYERAEIAVATSRETAHSSGPATSSSSTSSSSSSSSGGASGSSSSSKSSRGSALPNFA